MISDTSDSETMSTNADENRDLTPREARDYFLDDRRAEATDWTIQSYYYKLTQWVEWCEQQGIDSMAGVGGWEIEQFKRWKQSQDLAPTTIKGQMNAVKQMMDYLARIDVVDNDLPEKTLDAVPALDPEDETSDKKLDQSDARALIEHYRDDMEWYAKVRHVALEILWHTGCRLGGLRALDLDDYDPDNRMLIFTHRVDTGTPLKNKTAGERAVGLSEEVCDVLDAYIVRERPDKRDEHGREPLLATVQGRPSPTTVRAWAYLATQPCVHMECPHGEHIRSCQYRERSHASKCPSSRSPHQIRTGAITMHRDRGMPMEATSERVNASPDVIERHYDKADELQRLEERRREHIEQLDASFEPNDGGDE